MKPSLIDLEGDCVVCHASANFCLCNETADQKKIRELKEEVFKLKDRLMEKDISIKVLGDMHREEVKALKEEVAEWQRKEQ